MFNCVLVIVLNTSSVFQMAEESPFDAICFGGW